MTTQTGPTDWPLNLAGCTGWETLPEPFRVAATDVARELLWILSGRRFGLTSLTVRPCLRSRGMEYWRLDPLLPPLPDGSIVRAWCGCTRAGCTCTLLASEIGLAGPIHSITTVTVDGNTVPPTAYLVRDHRWLLRIDGGTWPATQNLTVTSTSPGSFAVTYQRGVAVPAGGQWAAGQLACEIGKAMSSDRECRLPRRVQQVVRQGVARTFLDPAQLARDGMTGLPEVDQWLAAVNPHHLPRDSVVWSPDLTPPVRRTS